MSAGTLTLTNNSAAVTGSGTAFTTELASGDFIVVTVGGVPYTLPVKSVESGTALTLVSNFTGPTQSGAAWSAVPRVALNMVTAALVAQSAEALRGLNYDKQNWQSIFSGSGNATVKLPDGSSFTGPAWGGIATTLDGKAGKGANSDITSLEGLTTALGLKYGGTGANTASGARTSLGLGSAATKDTGTSRGNVMQVGEFGLGLTASSLTDYQLGNPLSGTQLFYYGGGGFWNDWGAGVKLNYADTHNFQIYLGGSNATLIGMVHQPGDYTKIGIHYSNQNTTRAADGTLKVASPVVKLFHDGGTELNDESEGCLVTRVGTGEYLIEGCIGLNADASWGGIDGGFDIPKDRNRQPMIWLDYEVNADGSVLVKTYHRTYPDAPEFARNERPGLIDGEPVDIPADQFVSVRVEMPHDSIWNLKQREEKEAKEKTERERQQNQQDTQS